MRIATILIVVTTFGCGGAFAASCKPGYEPRHAYPNDPACVAHKVKHKAKTPANNDKVQTPVTHPAIRNPTLQTGRASQPLCKPGYQPRLAQPEDFTCVSHHVAQRTANENATAAVNGKPNPMTTNLDLSCKKPDYVHRRATPTDNVCVSRASSAQARVDNDRVAH